MTDNNEEIRNEQKEMMDKVLTLDLFRQGYVSLEGILNLSQAYDVNPDEIITIDHSEYQAFSYMRSIHNQVMISIQEIKKYLAYAINQLINSNGQYVNGIKINLTDKRSN